MEGGNFSLMYIFFSYLVLCMYSVQQATGISAPHGGSCTDAKNRLRVSPLYYCIIKTLLVCYVCWVG